MILILNFIVKQFCIPEKVIHSFIKNFQKIYFQLFSFIEFSIRLSGISHIKDTRK